MMHTHIYIHTYIHTHFVEKNSCSIHTYIHTHFVKKHTASLSQEKEEAASFEEEVVAGVGFDTIVSNRRAVFSTQVIVVSSVKASASSTNAAAAAAAAAATAAVHVDIYIYPLSPPFFLSFVSAFSKIGAGALGIAVCGSLSLSLDFATRSCLLLSRLPLLLVLVTTFSLCNSLSLSVSLAVCLSVCLSLTLALSLSLSLLYLCHSSIRISSQSSRALRAFVTSAECRFLCTKNDARMSGGLMCMHNVYLLIHIGGLMCRHNLHHLPPPPVQQQQQPLWRNCSNSVSERSNCVSERNNCRGSNSNKCRNCIKKLQKCRKSKPLWRYY
jgi:hypothetical protein